MNARICSALLLFALLLAGCAPAQVPAASAPADGLARDIITVTGNGSAMSKPDRAEVRFGVMAENADPRRAMASASEISAKVNAALKKAGVAAEDLRTGSVDLNPQYDYSKNRPRLTGYRCSIDVSARTKDIAKVGDIIVAATTAGATSVGGISFDLADDNPARYEASAGAVKDARSRAEAIATAAGRALGDVISIGEPVTTSSGRNAYTDGMDVGMPYGAFAARAVPVEPGQLKAGTAVTVVFALK